MDIPEFDFPTHVVKETQTRTVRGGIIVILVTRVVRDSDGGTVHAVQEDAVALDGKAASELVSNHLTS